jgi:hypothetical protein
MWWWAVVSVACMRAVLQLLVLLSSATPVGWWWCVVSGVVVAFVDGWCCDVSGVVCILVGIVVVWPKGCVVGVGVGGGVWDVDIWTGVGWGVGGMVCGGRVYGVVYGVACDGGGGGVAVFCRHSQQPSIAPAQFILVTFPVVSYFLSSGPSLSGY